MEQSKNKKIIITKNGPYMVSGQAPLNLSSIGSDSEGTSVDWEKRKEYQPEEEPYYLCRCGKSHYKPFCDGQHEKTGFVGHEKADRVPYAKHAKRLAGAAVDLLDDKSLCVGARFCDRGLTVWGLVEESDNPDNLKMAVEEACNCPAGRLTVVDNEGRMLEPQLPQEISVVEDPVKSCRGPLWVRGGIALEGADGEQYETRNRVTLCRCGKSNNQPYCDGSHYACKEMQGLDSD